MKTKDKIIKDKNKITLEINLEINKQTGHCRLISLFNTHPKRWSLALGYPQSQSLNEALKMVDRDSFRAPLEYFGL